MGAQLWIYLRLYLIILTSHGHTSSPIFVTCTQPHTFLTKDILLQSSSSVTKIWRGLGHVLEKDLVKWEQNCAICNDDKTSAYESVRCFHSWKEPYCGRIVLKVYLSVISHGVLDKKNERNKRNNNLSSSTLPQVNS